MNIHPQPLMHARHPATCDHGFLNGSGAGAAAAVVCEHHAYGGAGALDLARAVADACQQTSDFRFLYELDQPIKVQPAQLAPLSSL